MADRIGVYFDKSTIGPFFDFDALVEMVENKWGNATPVVKHHALLSGKDGVQTIKTDIEENELDGVLVVGASPRVDWEFYDFGPEVIVERVNLREHVVLSFLDPEGEEIVPIDPEEDEPNERLVDLAKDYIFMGVAKIKGAKRPEPEIPQLTKTIMVLGGGWTGLNAALCAADAGYDVVIVEKQAELGGAARNLRLTIPLRSPHQEAHDTGLTELISKVESHEKITVKINATLEALKGAPGLYTAVVNGEETAVGSVVMATGWQALNTKWLAPLGYGQYKNVVTTAEFEKMAKEGPVKRPSDGKPAQRVAFILNTELCEPNTPIYMDSEACDLQADVEPDKNEEVEVEVIEFKDLEGYAHLPMAKQVNSVVALKQAGYVINDNPEGIAYIFYDHMIVQGIYERYYKAAQDKPGVMLTKADITSITEEADGGLLVTAANTLLGGDIAVPVDMVVLPTGMVPSTAKDSVMHFEYRQGPAFPDLDLFEGFADSNYICFPYETRRTGVYAAGATRQPMLMDSAAEDAAGAALKAIQCIESANRGMSVHPRSGDMSYPVFNFVRCTQCKRCTEECPFGALDDDEKGTPLPNPTRCRRCGTCMGACPERVISFDNYSVGNISDVIRQYNVPDSIEEGGPRVLILACENDAYPALDMAALRGHKWSSYVRIIPVRCLGSINAIWVKDAMSRGTDGVMLLGCKYGDNYQCHFVKGSEICNRRKSNIAETLQQLGIESDRVEQYEVAIDDFDKVPGMIEEFMNMILEKGPNPFKGF